jgi:hypothetical protein
MQIVMAAMQLETFVLLQTATTPEDNVVIQQVDLIQPPPSEIKLNRSLST